MRKVHWNFTWVRVLNLPATSRCRLRMYVFITVRVVLLVEETQMPCLSHTAGREVLQTMGEWNALALTSYEWRLFCGCKNILIYVVTWLYTSFATEYYSNICEYICELTNCRSFTKHTIHLTVIATGMYKCSWIAIKRKIGKTDSVKV
jgi:hypothetical protein